MSYTCSPVDRKFEQRHANAHAHASAGLAKASALTTRARPPRGQVDTAAFFKWFETYKEKAADPAVEAAMALRVGELVEVAPAAAGDPPGTRRGGLARYATAFALCFHCLRGEGSAFALRSHCLRG